MRKKYSSYKIDNVIFLIIFITIPILFLNPLHEQNLQKDKPPLLTCIYCKGTGERVEDVNRIMFLAKTQLYLNKHLTIDKCEKCVKIPETGSYIYCDEANNQYSVFLKEYGAVGPKMEKTICGECMGGGQFKILTKNPKTNQWYTQEDYEEDERAKTNQ
jgi:hypothetical protein